ncbi:hypothetical protein KC901_01710 [Patescibacteria group bacterium]|nr:hypothetical protein [Patescibacteria group bacterium]
MIIQSQYVYLVTTFVSLIPALIFFFTHKRYRLDMMSVGLVVAVLSLLSARLFWTKDWWFPETITGGNFGIEDFILGFYTGSFAVIINTLFFPVRVTGWKNKNWNIVFSTVVLSFISILIFFNVFSLSSFNSFLISSVVAVFWMFARSKINPVRTVYFAVVYSVFSLWLYFFILLINKDWIQQTWDLDLLSGITLFGFIPIEEYVFWLVFGVIFRQIYLAWLNNKKD